VIEVNVTSTDFSVVVTDSVKNITVTADNSLFTVTSVSSNVTVTNVTPVITFTTEGFDFDFAIKHRGEWISNNDYTRNDVVRYENSIYICQIPFNVILTSATPPLNDTNSWELFYWNQWPKQYLTITNWLDVGTDIEAGGNLTVAGNAQISGTTRIDSTLTINGDAVINGRLQGIGEFIANTGTFNTTLNVGADNTTNGTFFINGLRYPQDKGTYGQVLFTGGDETSQAAWVNLGELTFWQLSEDLKTEGFNIVSGGNANQLTIGRGTSSNIVTSIEFPRNQDQINFDAARVDFNGLMNVDGNLTVNDSLRVNDTYKGSGTAERMKPFTGIQFPDGTFLDSANFTTGTTGTFILPIASTTRLGVVKIGDGLEITESGILSTSAAGYVLPAATTSTRGGVRIGNGITITDGDIINISTTTEYSNISLTEDMRTNGFKIKHSNTDPNNYLDINDEDITLNCVRSLDLNGVTVTIDASSNAIVDGATSVQLLNGTGKNLTINNSAITANHPTLVDLKAPVLRAGSDINNSKIQASSYYNYAGTGAAFFPANIKFSDDTIQRTAWRGYDQGLIVF
jgi:hypothetical protein